MLSHHPSHHFSCPRAPWRRCGAAAPRPHQCGGCGTPGGPCGLCRSQTPGCLCAFWGSILYPFDLDFKGKPAGKHATFGGPPILTRSQKLQMDQIRARHHLVGGLSQDGYTFIHINWRRMFHFSIETIKEQHNHTCNSRRTALPVLGRLLAFWESLVVVLFWPSHCEESPPLGVRVALTHWTFGLPA